MKQKLLAFFLAVTVLFTCSCNREKPDESKIDKITSSVLAEGEIETGTVAGDYIFRTVPVHEQQLLLKYHIPTGTVTTVCQDPFCDHELTCPFAVGSSRMVAIGNILYYVSEVENQSEIRSYNGDDMKIEQIYTSDGVLANLYTYYYYLYFTVIHPGEDTDYNATVYRMDTQTKDIIEINRTSRSERIYQIKENKIIWSKGSSYYSTDLNGNYLSDVTLENLPRGNYTYRIENKSEGLSPDKMKFDLYRKNISTGEEALVAKDIGPYYFYGDRIIYFTCYGKKFLMATTDGRDHYNYFGGEVYVMNHDGSDNRLLCNVDNCYIIGLSPNRNNELICGDWIGILAANFYEDNGVKLYTNTDLLLVNVVTGEYKYAAYNPFE